MSCVCVQQVVELLLEHDAARRYRAWMAKAVEQEEVPEQKTPVNSPLHWAAFKVLVPSVTLDACFVFGTCVFLLTQGR